MPTSRGTCSSGSDCCSRGRSRRARTAWTHRHRVAPAVAATLTSSEASEDQPAARTVIVAMAPETSATGRVRERSPTDAAGAEVTPERSRLELCAVAPPPLNEARRAWTATNRASQWIARLARARRLTLIVLFTLRSRVYDDVQGSATARMSQTRLWTGQSALWVSQRSFGSSTAGGPDLLVRNITSRSARTPSDDGPCR